MSRKIAITGMGAREFVAPVLVGLLWRFLLHDSYGIYTFFLRQVMAASTIARTCMRRISG